MGFKNLRDLTIPRRGAVAAPVVMEVVRELTREDLDLLWDTERKISSTSVIKQARAIHHRQAQLVAEGRKDVEIAAIVGSTPQRIRDLKKDPTFENLVGYYREQQAEIEFETHARVQGKLVDVLELAVDEIQLRLEDESKRAALPMSELRKTAEFAADRTIAPTKGTSVATLPPAKIELNFGFKPKQASEPEPSFIDITPADEP